jgi:hypothetical protein
MALNIGTRAPGECAKLWCDHAVRADSVWFATGRKPLCH